MVNSVERHSALSKRQAIRFVCLFVFLAAAVVAPLHGQSKRSRPAPQYLQLGAPDQDKGKRILDSFRHKGLYAGDNYFEFELRVMPRRGAEKTVQGRLWTGDNENGPVSRYVLAPGVKGMEDRLLVQNGRARLKATECVILSPWCARELRAGMR